MGLIWSGYWLKLYRKIASEVPYYGRFVGFSGATKYILIYMASHNLDKKLELLKNYDFSLWGIPYMYNVILPISFGLFYTFVYPWLSQLFYSYTLNRQKTLKTIKTKAEDQTPITQEEAKALKKENYDKTEILLELEDKIAKIRSDYDMRITTIEDDTKHKITTELNTLHQKKIKELKQDYEENIEKTKKALDEDYKGAYQELMEEKGALKDSLFKTESENKRLKAENEKLLVQIPKQTIHNETAKEKILRYFYESNYRGLIFQDALDSIVKKTNIARPKVSQVIDELMGENILKTDSGFLKVTQEGNYYLVQKFDKESKK